MPTARPGRSPQYQDVPVTALQPKDVPPSSDVYTIEQIAVKLHKDVEWVESKCRRRCPYPIPFHNVGNHRLFIWSEVFAWVMNAPQVVHSKHRRRTKEEIAASVQARAAKKVRKAA